ncbi:ATP-binding cassette domain-containing protein [Rothia sp. CCM 9418]|uniref:ATP-binding cassette domain-containing protein n=1 Tax=Rothia sp. CCM 9418 TaxID=3402661 RepID=UPI003ADB1D05
MIKIEELFFSYGNHVVFDDVTFQLPERGLVAVTGRNGVGKTTLLRILGRVYQAHFIGSPQFTATYIDTEYLTLDTLTVAEVVDVLSRQGKHLKSEMLSKNPLITQQMLSTQLGALSLGQRQRLVLAIACSLPTSSMLLLDEPFNGLDVESCTSAQDQLVNISQEKSILFATHNLQDMNELATHILHIDGPHLISLEKNTPK